ncbi:serine/threonine-protein kinase STY13-like isoform X1 [Ziziphus jujuba]|uniref:non-specific serine/threonine protein kinase n=1 Tax=Ziziphus jujuba TaxID=326968 RepID=A0A6P6FTR6_ZIZJJ|nr:serine/threonine-protein kinase STY13-like isoform X1 [Ziziphus jujuba]
MKEGSDGFVRADQIDLKSLDEQLERHMSRALTMEKSKKLRDEQGNTNNFLTSTASTTTTTTTMSFLTPKKQRQEWEIDPSKLIIKGVIARGTFATVHRGVYDGQDVAAIGDRNCTLTESVTCTNGFRMNLLVTAKKLDAVKLLDWGEEGHRAEAEVASLRAAFTQEVAVWHKLDHPNVTKFIGAKMGSAELQIQTDNGLIGMPSNICCVVVEYLAGGTLKSYLIRNMRKKLAFKIVVQLGLDLARGLSYLHSQKIVHRDVKTENMLLDKTRTVKIADFGVARVEASNPNDMTGETGTLGYMAPEVLNGNPYNRKCDVYSFGICLWEIYCCDMPYPDLTFSEVTSAVVRQNLRPDIPRCCPSSLANVMKRCWDASPEKRPEMDEVVSMLEAIDTSKGGGMIPPDQAQGCLCFRKYRGP